jgi:hypothetical protein
MRLDLFFEGRAIGKGIAIDLLFHGVENFASRFHAQIGGQKSRLDFF